jgi:hypothetical protein
MAWTSGAGQSGIYVNTIIELLKQTATTGNTTGLLNASHKIALHNSASLTAGTSPLNWDVAAPVTWVNTGEVSGTGWAAGGPTFTTAGMGTPTLTVSPTGSLMYDSADVSVASTTLTNARGCILYMDPVTAVLTDAMIVAVCFGADFSTSNGTFGVQWAATGIFAIDLTP